jgi:hypothetical protein
MFRMKVTFHFCSVEHIVIQYELWNLNHLLCACLFLNVYNLWSKSIIESVFDFAKDLIRYVYVRNYVEHNPSSMLS